MEIKKLTRKDEEYFKVEDGKIIAFESLMYGDDDDIYENKKDYRFSLSKYEGPLDLLLYLVRRSKINIEDIFVSDITEQYLEIIQPITEWDETEIEYAGDFITMAAELVEYKSKRMLPTEQPDMESGELPGDELIRRLQEYDMFKQMSAKLHEAETINVFYREPQYTENDYRIAIKEFSISKMLDAYARMIHRINREEKLQEPKKIMKERYSVTNRINYIGKEIFEKKNVKLFSLFDDDFNKLEIINTFLAMLELMKRQVVTVKQDETFGNIDIELREGIEKPIQFTESEIEQDKTEDKGNEEKKNSENDNENKNLSDVPNKEDIT